ncbi:hypothetical protein C8F04DRAFT_117570 [Mycena alexandri]|uniref:F-box domain-containing protein n=1 Tax=Mycena alexandri TaxID=1745969 RepID=A0AAD6T9X9_9AGAR|nr:hypothetical protein C8F04DRAFT_117570 [Mycena alexandri]
MLSPGLLSPPLTGGPRSPSLKSPLSPGFSRMINRARSLTSLGSKRSSRRSEANAILNSVPPELWLKVFMNIPLHLLPAVTLTCRSFHALSQPLLFSTVSTHPPALPSLALRGAQTSKYRKRILERLEFFFSPRICPSVVECAISPLAPEEDGAPTDDLIDTIFASLSRLPNLKVLSCRYVRLTPKRLAVLQNLQLTTISLEMCFGEIADFADAPSVPLQTVTFKYPDAIRRDKVNPCLLFLSPTHLEQLHATTTSILPTLARSQPFRKLQTLDIPIECITSDIFIQALSRCPAVDHLSLHTSGSVPRSLLESLPEGVLPNLTSYRGPHHYAAVFLRNRYAKRVEISVPSRPHRLGASLPAIDRTLLSLSFRLEGVELPASLLTTIHASFPKLKSLTVGEPALSSADINGVLNASPRHVSLEEITIHIQGRDKFNLWIPPDEAAADAISCFKKTLPALLATYPGLRSVRFMHGSEGASVKWRRSSSGLFVQSAA